ncbi:MAG: 7-carboxy-7-deazaguanine synthase QueE [Oceanococcus sp.]
MNDSAPAELERIVETRVARLKITEVFHSLQGEARDAGWPTTFIRLTGCPLRCQYCDTAYAFHGGHWRDIDDILTDPLVTKSRHICVTGGEPLAQKGCRDLLKKLCQQGYQVSLETSGAMDISGIDARVSRVVDIKTPDSGELTRNRWENIALLTNHDQIKFVICSQSDFEWAVRIVNDHQLSQRCDVWISPSHSQVDAEQLANWVIDSGLPLRFQLQLHKILWNDEPGH